MSTNGSKLNWFISVVVSANLGLLGWNLYTTHTLAIDSADLTRMVQDGKEQRLRNEQLNESAHTRIENAILNVVTKREFELRIQMIEERIKMIETKNKI